MQLGLLYFLARVSLYTIIYGIIRQFATVGVKANGHSTLNTAVGVKTLEHSAWNTMVGVKASEYSAWNTAIGVKASEHLTLNTAMSYPEWQHSAFGIVRRNHFKK